jgi:hypothetical protein
MTNAAALPTALHAAAVSTGTVEVVTFYWPLLYATDRAKIAACTDKFDALDAFDAAMDLVPVAVAYAAAGH